jgi:glycosyltransferase involved in cell wall biosynthesis
MRLSIIQPELPPVLNGIGDYTALIARELARSCEVTLLTDQAGSPHPIAGVRCQPAYSVADPTSFRELPEHAAEEHPDAVLLQYNPFSYGRWGLNPFLPRAWRQIRRRGIRTVLMVHEPFVPVLGPKWAVMTTWQRAQLWMLGRHADRVFFSTEPWADRFRRWFPRQQVEPMPVGSNIERVAIGRAEARWRLGIPEESLVLGQFGTAHNSRLPDLAARAVRAVADRKVLALAIGPGGKACAPLGDVPQIAAGPLPEDEVSRRMAAIDIYLAPFVDGISTRRTTVMTALQHGIALVGTDGSNTGERFRREHGRSLLLADVHAPDQFEAQVRTLAEDAPLRGRLGVAARALYDREFTWSRLAERLREALQGVDQRVLQPSTPGVPHPASER